MTIFVDCELDEQFVIQLMREIFWGFSEPFLWRAIFWINIYFIF